MDRRRFVKDSLRYTATAALLGTATWLLTRERPMDSKACDFDFICMNCKKNRDCKLPEAKTHRNNEPNL